ncbi:PREDICTED: von Willebrand factor A domain-containing protein 3A-like [Amphimedon queenslandica]|nr:PREDICTED: von Willebrand factor A domain-containing protein 3A-like [Amphimedon queenslandica]|eukprot:XP_011405803.2 PREDICTED: von Willebrand factor A domain-containing protein 3A-like [Amphimedon queenslandica]
MDRLQWLLTDSRYVFGCIAGRKVVILVDVSSSMRVHQSHLKDQLKTLLREQLAKKRISFFNIIAFSTDVTSWQTSLVPNTSRQRSEAEGWIQKLIFGGCSNLDEAITCSLKQKGQEIYLISDGDTDHTSTYLMSQVKELKKAFPFNWHINSIAYQTTRNESLCFLQTIAKETKGRYHFYSSERQLDKSTVLEKSKALYLERQLGDDVKGLADEIALADYSIKQSLYYLGRYS